MFYLVLSRTWQKFWKVSATGHLLRKVTGKSTFQNGKDEGVRQFYEVLEQICACVCVCVCVCIVFLIFVSHFYPGTQTDSSVSSVFVSRVFVCVCVCE